ncbi:hypothetical protein N7490_001929 [Penicillium lividum]|nr:hypothetical protein N7490_001929 [Penicillium lividum]
MAPKKIDAEDLSGLYSKFQSLPKSENWKVLFSYDEGRRQEIVRHLISGLAPLKSKSPSMLSSNPLISALHRYSESMKATALDQANPTKPKNRPFACFRELVFCSMCAVARITTKSEIVYDIMRSVYGSDACSERFRALIRGAKWANEAIYHLSRTKCGKRSWDIVYTIERQVDYFTRLSPIIRPDVLIAGLDEDFYPEESSETSVPLAIPSIIRRISDYKVPLEDICEVLGYPFSDYQRLELSGLERFLLETQKRVDDCAEVSTNRSSSTACSSSPLSPIDPDLDGSLEAFPNDASTLTQRSDTDTPDLNSGMTDVNNNKINHSTSSPFVPPSTTTSQHIKQTQQSRQNQRPRKRKDKKETFDNPSKRQRCNPAVSPEDGCVQTPTPPSSACSASSESPSRSDIEGQFAEHQTSTLTSAASPLSRQSDTVIGDVRSRQSDACVSPYLVTSSVHLSSSTNQQQGNDFKSYHFTSVTPQQSLPENENLRDPNGTSHVNDAYYPTTPSPDSGMEEALNDDTFEAFCLPPNPDPLLSTDWGQQYGWEIDDMLQQGHAPNSLGPLLSTDWGQQYGWEIDDMLQQGHAPNSLGPLLSTDWGQQYGWEIDDMLQQGHAPNSLGPLLSTNWGQQYGWEIDDMLQQGHAPNNPGLPLTTDWRHDPSLI